MSLQTKQLKLLDMSVGAVSVVQDVAVAAAPAVAWVDCCVIVQLQQLALLQVALHHGVDARVCHLHTSTQHSCTSVQY
jgi:hypothetical protein